MVQRKTRWKRDYRQKREHTKRSAMLNVGKVRLFKYDINEVMHGSATEDKFVDSFIATVISKASKSSIADAKEYVDSKVEDGTIDDESRTKIFRLLERYTRYR